MGRRFVIVILAVLSLALCCASQCSARIWSSRQVSFDLGYQPSMALLYGVQPVVSSATYSSSGTVVHLTAFGEEAYTHVSGNIAGDGQGTIVGYQHPVYYGNDGRFYSYTGDPPMPKEIHGGVGPVWPYTPAYPWLAPVGVDAGGGLYMAVASNLAKLVGGSWSDPLDLDSSFGIKYAYDLSVSRFGDVGVVGSGPVSEELRVAWYDFKTSTWNWRSLTTSWAWGFPNIEWDRKGNLGVAYEVGTDPGSHVKFDYLDMGTALWTSEVVDQGQGTFYQKGQALVFDRFDNPVIASGTYVFYDPIPALVPEPGTLLAVGLGAISMLGYARKRAR